MTLTNSAAAACLFVSPPADRHGDAALGRGERRQRLGSIGRPHPVFRERVPSSTMSSSPMAASGFDERWLVADARSSDRVRVHATDGEGQHVETRQVHEVTVVGGDEERALVAEQRQQAPQPGAHGATVDVPVTQLDRGEQALALGRWELGEAVGDRVQKGQHRGVRHVGVTSPADEWPAHASTAVPRPGGRVRSGGFGRCPRRHRRRRGVVGRRGRGRARR